MAVKRKGRVNYTHMTLKYLREQGCSVDKVEKFNQYAGPFGQREDAFGFIDIIALDPDDRKRIIAIQSTGPSGHAEHLHKIRKNRFALEWLQCGGLIELWSWRKILVGKKARRWHPRVQRIKKEDFE